MRQARVARAAHAAADLGYGPCSAADVIHLDVMHAAGSQLIAQFTVAVEPSFPDRADQRRELAIAGAAAQRRAQVRPSAANRQV